MVNVTCCHGSLILWIVLAVISTVSAGFFDKKSVQIALTKYNSCDPKRPAKNGFWLKDFRILPTSDGDVTILGTFITGVNITSPLKAVVSMRRHFMGLYVPIPCINKFGSCEYTDLCSYGYPLNEECPPVLDENDVPCRCPIEPGMYVFPGGQFKTPKTRWTSLMAGKYKSMVKLYTRGKLMACYIFLYDLTHL